MSGRQAGKAASSASLDSLGLGSLRPVGLQSALGRLDSSMVVSPKVSRMMYLLQCLLSALKPPYRTACSCQVSMRFCTTSCLHPR